MVSWLRDFTDTPLGVYPNLGHLTRLVRSDFLVDAKVLSKVEGTPFRVGEIQQAILQEIEHLESSSAAGGQTTKEAAP